MKINKETLKVLKSYRAIPLCSNVTEVDDSVFIGVLQDLWRHFNYSIDLQDETDIASIGIDIDKMLGTEIFINDKK